MPIKFRCPHCRQFLGISRSKAGEIADCPMCGKTVRVPNLDGSVQPLPKPELNLQDSSLVDALGELAGIGSEKDSEHQSDAPSGNELATVALKPVAEPIVLEPLQPAEPVHVSAPATKKRTRQRVTARGPLDTKSSVAIEEPTLDEPEIAAVGQRPSPHSAAALATPSTLARRGWWPIAVILGVLGLGSIGLLMMNRTTAPPAAAADQPAANGAPADDAATVAADAAPAVTGRITYVSEAGDTRPDDGAKIIVLPAQRGGTIKLDVAGFIVGSGDVDTQVAAAALKALGGDVATADEQGKYSLELDDAGSYQLLVISRHQSRPWEVGVESSTQELLDRFFIRPSTLLGQLAYEVQSFQYRGQGTSPRDFAFERQ